METQANKYNCSQCKFSCNTKARWDAHIKTELHKTGKRKQRRDYKEPFKCKECDYNTKNTVTFKAHILNHHANKETREKEFKYYCKLCDFGTFSNDIITTHNETERHKLMIKRNQ
ncbi:hypothetical protein Klosneuvirus_15_4 [Klosneuvirus KNV1]|uniref:C2H2-type domain-containing protein n=1 Tax=Klosneuvirus KNV1 TaxID=1977640 RepID=A0A1V0SLS8_9VIRU|nr:hypothetical protein Klosneuvirus_15_4 [Klosneuvirus KNV1]